MNQKESKKTLGEFLKKEREAKKISLEKFSELSKISKKNLINIERNEFLKIPSIYLDLYLKKYAQLLNLNYSDFQNIQPLKSVKSSDNLNRYSMPRFVINPKISTLVLMIVLFFGVGIYFIYQFQNLFGLPTLKINYPTSDIEIIQSDNINISGKTDKDSILKINGRKISLREDGTFEEIINIHEGLNIIKVEAVSSHGRINSITKMILRE